MKQIFKHIIFYTILMVLNYSCQNSNTISSSSLNKVDGIYKLKEKPFTGVVLDTTNSGRVLITFNCKAGKLEGEYLEYHWENGNLKERTTYDKGKKTGPYLLLTKDGGTIVSGNYLNYQKNDLWTEYYNNGNVEKRETYIEGQRNGKAQYFFKNGQVKAETNLKNDKIHGDMEFYRETGLIKMKEHYKDGVIDEMELYDENGAITQKTVHKKGEIIQITLYHANGQIKSKAHLKDGEFNGDMETYDESGKLTETIIFENGKQITKQAS